MISQSCKTWQTIGEYETKKQALILNSISVTTLIDLGVLLKKKFQITLLNAKHQLIMVTQAITEAVYL